MLKRLVRFVLSFVLAAIAVVLTGVVILSFQHDWQRELIDGALEQQTGMQWDFEEAYFERPNRLSAKTVFVLQDAQGVEVESIRLDFDLGRSLGTDEVVVRQGAIEALRLDLSAVPAEAFGLNERQLARGVPDREQTLEAVRQLTELALTRVAAMGLQLELNDLVVTGQVFLPGDRQLLFAETIRHARTDDPASLRFEIDSAEFR